VERHLFALAFALRGTLTKTDHLERDAFLELVRERSGAVGAPYREIEAVAAAEFLFPAGNCEVVAPARAWPTRRAGSLATRWPNRC
jgi:hypothetical protein